MSHILLEGVDCGVCKGIGKVYIVNRLYQPDSLELCGNCNGLGIVFPFGTFKVGFKVNNELPLVKRTT